eukprot:575417-Pyramimonas_sp.AAC.1
MAQRSEERGHIPQPPWVRKTICTLRRPTTNAECVGNNAWIPSKVDLAALPCVVRTSERAALWGHFGGLPLCDWFALREYPTFPH